MLDAGNTIEYAHAAIVGKDPICVGVTFLGVNFRTSRSPWGTQESFKYRDV